MVTTLTPEMEDYFRSIDWENHTAFVTEGNLILLEELNSNAETPQQQSANPTAEVETEEDAGGEEGSDSEEEEDTEEGDIEDNE